MSQMFPDVMPPFIFPEQMCVKLDAINELTKSRISSFLRLICHKLKHWNTELDVKKSLVASLKVMHEVFCNNSY